MASKLVYGDQIQVRMKPEDLEAKRRHEWGKLYIGKQTEKARMFV